jgi:hypothetical protein
VSPTPPEHLQPYSDAIALTVDDREVRVFQAHEGGRVEYAVRDDRFADGWRPVMDADEIAQLVASINTRPADPDPEPDPEAEAADMRADAEAGQADVDDPDAPLPDGHLDWDASDADGEPDDEDST